jgi:5-methylcytosine-specific restriction endonuclease McrA
VYRSPHALQKRTFCNRTCHGAWNAVHVVGSNAANFKGALHRFTCKGCNTTFESYHKKRVFCSTPCKARSQSKPKVQYTCDHCGVLYEDHESTGKWRSLRGHRRSFCSKTCQHDFYSGENHRLWLSDRGALKAPNKSIRTSKEMRAWRETVFTRDNHTCQLCRDRSCAGNAVVLNAHHILPYSRHEDRRFDPNNGITLCEPCHITTRGRELAVAHLFFGLLETKGAKTNEATAITGRIQTALQKGNGTRPMEM